ncbi:phytanoyl-CoA dioxygenase family protein [Psychrobacillus sp. FSL H8-0510]|uniref:phytanoyl-CoA dioxygenase family protein n=1 Tax=Psychrobacillus sp. FSL H8-0510 TaxID=2921394 RepID=UPI0030FB3043
MDQNLKMFYEENGYLILNNYFSKFTVKELKIEVKNIFFTGREMKSRVSLDVDKLKKQGVFIGLSRISSLYKETVNDSKLIGLLNEILGEEIKFVDDKVVFKDAKTDFGSPWHQDWHYWKGQHKFSLWIALDNVTLENGCLKVVPGSHKNKIEHEDIGGDGFSKWILPENINEQDVVSLPVEAGSIILLHDLLFHASLPNKTGEDRWAFIPTYQYSWSFRDIFEGKIKSQS